MAAKWCRSRKRTPKSTVASVNVARGGSAERASDTVEDVPVGGAPRSLCRVIVTPALGALTPSKLVATLCNV